MTEHQEPENSQAQDQNGYGELQPDEIIQKLISDPAAVPDLRVIVGFLGESPQKGYWRLYLTLELNNYVEFSEEDCLHSRPLRTEQNPLGGTLVWVKRDAKLQHTRTTPTRTQAEFLQGEVTQRFLPEIGTEGAISGLGNVAQILALRGGMLQPTLTCTIVIPPSWIWC